ncbi:MFS transporter [Microvirga lotononidis]|uniref:Major Facilitator Superfamily transporter n=1 Tax=Microvirga lotononidis TaxID=864069 RepID=I4Z2X6_9HYPH|nr:MFS transporter [Microvirga lotononidis]EIM30568.1 Major Facilitator Superfamily transporter [Microvirga lotononidis]WQO26396.1 MFS transporter [Microvirga lotononidis]
MTRRDLLPARLAASAIFFGNGFGIGTWAAQLPRFKESLGLSDGQLSLGLLAFSLGAVALMPVIGWAVTVVGSRTMTTIAAFAFAAALALPGLAPNLSLFVAAALLAGACNGTMDIAMNTNATVVEKAWGSAIMSSLHAFFSLGGLAGAGASGLLIALNVGIVPTLLISCLGMGLLFLVAAFWTLGETERSAEGHGFAWPRGSVMILAVLAMFCFLVEGAMVDWSAIYLQTVAGASLETAVTGFAAFSLAMTVCRFMGDFVVRHLGRVRTVQFGGLLSAFGLALAMLLPQPLPAAIGFSLVGIGLANAVPVLFSTAGQMKDFPPSMGVAMVATLGYGGLLLGPPLIGFGGEIFGLRAMLGVLIGLAFVIIILSQRALRRGAV